MRRRDGIAGVLLGLVVGERLNGAAPASELGVIVASALTLAERLCRDSVAHDGELARAIIDHSDSDARYGQHLAQLFASWEAGMPLALAAFQLPGTHGGGGSDFAAALLGPVYALRYPPSAGLGERVRHAATIVDGDPVGVDAAAVMAAAVAAALEDEDPLTAGRRAAGTLELSRALQLAATLADHGVHAASLCEHLGTGSAAVDAIPTAILCARGARTFTDALGDALEAATGGSAVPACTAAIAGARFGADAISSRLVSAIEPEIRGRVEQVAARLSVRSDTASRPNAPPP
jgi:ADP-ribosylglycohydrolase